jgi:hypothetical protein
MPPQPPGIGVAADVPPPGERLVGDPDAVPAGPLGEQPQLGRGPGLVAFAQQAHGSRGFAQVQDGQGLIFPVAFADPFFAEAEFGHGSLHVKRRQVPGASQLDAVVTDSVQQPGVGAHHAGGGCRIDVRGLVQPDAGEQPPQFPLASGVADGVQQAIERPREAARSFRGAGGGLARQFQASEHVVDLVDVERSGPHTVRFDVITVETGELGDRVGMMGMSGVGSRGNQLVGAGTAAVLRWPVPPPGGACRSRDRGGPGQDRFEPDRVLPAVAEVILVEQFVTGSASTSSSRTSSSGTPGSPSATWKGHR